MEVVLATTWAPSLRVPDVVVVGTARIDMNPNLLCAQDVLLAVEVVSPGSARTDRVTKRHEYAGAGLSSYWVVDLEEPVTLVESRLSVIRPVRRWSARRGRVDGMCLVHRDQRALADRLGA